MVVRDARLTQGLTQQDLAQVAGVSRQWIVALEKGAPRAEIGRVLEVLRALGLTTYAGIAKTEPTVTFADLDL